MNDLFNRQNKQMVNNLTMAISSSFLSFMKVNKNKYHQYPVYIPFKQKINFTKEQNFKRSESYQKRSIPLAQIQEQTQSSNTFNNNLQSNNEKTIFQNQSQPQGEKIKKQKIVLLPPPMKTQKQLIKQTELKINLPVPSPINYLISQNNLSLYPPIKKCPFQFEKPTHETFKYFKFLKKKYPQLRGLKVLDFVDGIYDAYYRQMSKRILQKYQGISQKQIDEYINQEYPKLRNAQRLNCLQMFLIRRLEQFSNGTDQIQIDNKQLNQIQSISENEDQDQSESISISQSRTEPQVSIADIDQTQVIKKNKKYDLKNNNQYQSYNKENHKKILRIAKNKLICQKKYQKKLKILKAVQFQKHLQQKSKQNKLQKKKKESLKNSNLKLNQQKEDKDKKQKSKNRVQKKVVRQQKVQIKIQKNEFLSSFSNQKEQV